MKEFNYIIATEWSDKTNQLCVYTIHNNSVHYGTQKDAERSLAYVKSQSPNKNWRIITVGFV